MADDPLSDLFGGGGGGDPLAGMFGPPPDNQWTRNPLTPREPSPLMRSLGAEKSDSLATSEYDALMSAPAPTEAEIRLQEIKARSKERARAARNEEIKRDEAGSDVLPQTRAVRQLATGISHGWDSALASMRASRADFDELFGSLSPEDATQRDADLIKAEDEIAQSPDGPLGWFGEQVGMVAGSLYSSGKQALKTAAAGAAAGGSVGGLPGAAAGASAGLTVGFGYDSFRANAGQIAGDLERARGPNGEKVDDDDQMAASLIGGGIMAGLDMVGFKVLSKPFTDAGRRLIAKEVAEELTAKLAARQGALTYAKSVGAETVTETVQQVVQDVATDVAKRASDEDFETIFNDPERRKQVVSNAVETALSTAAGMSVVGAPGGVLAARRPQAKPDVPLTPEDHASPIPNDVIQEGKNLLRDAVEDQNTIKEKTVEIEPISAREPVTEQVNLDQIKARIRGVESSGNDKAVNPLSSASGRYQFTDGTWTALGGDPAKKNDPAEQERLMDKLLDQNTAALEKAGVQPTSGNVYLAHFLGSGGAINALSNPDAEVNAKVQAANPFTKGWTNAQLAAWADKKMGGKGQFAQNANTSAPDVEGDLLPVDLESVADRIERLTGEEVTAFEPGQRVAVTQGEKTTAGTVRELYGEGEQQGVRIDQDDGTVFDETIAQARQYGARFTHPAPDLHVEQPAAPIEAASPRISVPETAQPETVQGAAIETETATQPDLPDAEQEAPQILQRVGEDSEAAVDPVELDEAIDFVLRRSESDIAREGDLERSTKQLSRVVGRDLTREEAVALAGELDRERKTQPQSVAAQDVDVVEDGRTAIVDMPGLKGRNKLRLMIKGKPGNYHAEAEYDIEGIAGGTGGFGDGATRAEAAAAAARVMHRHLSPAGFGSSVTEKHRKTIDRMRSYLRDTFGAEDDGARALQEEPKVEAKADDNPLDETAVLRAARNGETLPLKARRWAFGNGYAVDGLKHIRLSEKGTAKLAELEQDGPAQEGEGQESSAASEEDRPTEASAPKSKFEPTDHLPALEEIIATGARVGNIKALAKKLDLTVTQTQRVALALVGKKGSGVYLTRKGQLRRVAKRTTPLHAMEFVRSVGGVRSGRHNLRNVGALGRFPGVINNKAGKSVDEIGEALWEAGYFLDRDPTNPDLRPDESETIEFLDEASRARKYSIEDINFVLEQRSGKDEDGAREEIGDHAAEYGLDLSEEDVTAALEYRGSGESVEYAVEAAVRDAAARTLDVAADETGQDFYAEVAGELYHGDEAELRDTSVERDSERPESEPVDTDRGAADIEEPGSARAQVTFAVPNEANEAARKRFPNRPAVQDHFIRGYMAELGDESAQARLVGSVAEDDGARFAQTNPVPLQPDAFGSRADDLRRSLEQRAEGRMRPKKPQKAPGEDGGLFDARDTTGALFADEERRTAAQVGEETEIEITPEQEASLREELQRQLDQLGIGDRVSLEAARKLDLSADYASGEYVYARRLIRVALEQSGDPSHTLAHEAIHAMRHLGLFTPAEWERMTRKAWADLELRRIIQESYPNLKEEWQKEEAAAELFADIYSSVRYETIIERAARRIRRFLKALADAVRKVFGAEVEPSMFYAIIEGEIGARPSGFGETVRGRKVTISRESAASVVGDITPAAPDFGGDTEKRWQEAKKGIGDGPGMAENARAWWQDLTDGFTRHWRDLPNEPRFSDVQQQLRKLESAPEAAMEMSIRYLRRLVADMTAEEYDLFSRKVVLDDLSWDAGEGRELPFGFTPSTLLEARQTVDAQFNLNPKLVDASRERKAHNHQVAEEMVQAGVLTREQIKNPAYFRHMVLDYARHEAALARSPSKVKSPYWARRMGSTLDINANLLEAELDWLQKAQVDITTANTIEWIKKSEHNTRDELRQRARDENRSALEEALASDPEASKEYEGFRANIGRGIQMVAEAIEKGSLDPIPPHLQSIADDIASGKRDGEPPFALFAWMLDNDKPGAIGAAMALKYSGLRKQWVRKLLGDAYAEPEDVAGLIKRYKPEGMVAWQPKEGRHLFTAKTISESALDMFVTRLADTATPGLDRAELANALGSVRQQLVVGGDRYTMALPAEIAATLDEFGDRRGEGMVARVFSGIQGAWKRWVLINPRRFFKYNLNNMTGDLDAIIAGNAGTLGHVKQAWTMLRDAQKDKIDPRYTDALDRGVFTAGLSAQEIPDINRFSEFRHLSGKPTLRPDKLAVRGVARIWRALQDTTNFRESLFRLAAYLDYVDKIEGGMDQLKIGYGASIPRMVDAVTDPKDRAALLARDLVGDYGAISVAGGWLRRYLVPFWSWTEINTRRYWRLTSNAFGQSHAKGIATGGLLGAGIGLRTALWAFTRMGMVYGLLYLWNHLLFPDEEDELGEMQRAQLHLILGRDSDGQVVTLRTQGALSDVLGTFGFLDAVQAFKKYQDGQGSIGGVAVAMGKGPVNRVATSATPIINEPVEQMIGQELWPDIFNPRLIHDRWRHFFQTVNLEHEYDHFAGKPTRGYARSWTESAVYRRDPGEMAYDEAKGIAFDWLERVKGQEGGAFVSSRSEALRDYRTAMRYGDDKAADKALTRYEELGGTAKGLKQSIAKQHPLGPISKKDRAAFLDSLTDEQLDIFAEAEDYWKRTYADE